MLKNENYLNIYFNIYKYNIKEIRNLIIKIIIILLFSYLLLKTKKAKDKYDKYDKYKSDKWIVLLTINPPSSIIDYLVHNLVDWKIIVLGDEKTKDDNWNIYNSSNVLIYISLKDQKKLEYKSLKYISKNSNTRKNIGYLFAIQHGAKEIYEIDDDIVFNDLNKVNKNVHNFQHSRISIGINKNTKMINPYAYFGIRDIWPRGFLLNDIAFDNNEFLTIYLKQIKLKPLIYQGLINREPDTDELLLQTRKSKNVSLNVFFNDNDPLLYLPGNYVPINSKNTRYLYDIFPSLPFVLSLNDKINDIYRGYIMQTYAWKIKGGVIFLPFNTYKFGNSNENNNNFIKEKKLFFEIKNFLQIIKQMIKKESEPKEFLLNIIKYLMKKKILKKKDLKIYLAFMDDLSTFNYIYSSNYNKREIIDNNYINYLNISSEFYIDQKVKGNIFLMNKKENKLLKHISSNKIYRNILLIIIYNYSKLIKLNEYMIHLYKKNFPNIIFLKEGFNNLSRNDIIECKESYRGFYSYVCFRKVFNKYPNMKGYLFIDDDYFFKPWHLENFNFNIPWMNTIFKHYNTSKPVSHDIRKTFLWKRLNNTYINMNYLLNKNLNWKNNISKFYGINVVNVFVDIIYIPNNIMNKFCDIIEIMYKSKIFIQTAIPTALGIMLLKKIHILNSIFCWKKKRKSSLNYLKMSHSYIGIHPIKFSNDTNKKSVNDYINFINALEY